MIKKKSFYIMALSLALPNIIQQLVTNLSQMVDNLMVGRLNELAIAGVSITNQIFFIFTILSLGLGAAGGIFITQYKGALKYEKITEVFRVEVIFGLVVGLIFFMIMHFFPTNILYLFAKDIETIDSALEYISFVKYTFLFYPISIIIGSAFRYIGHIKLPMYISIVAVLVNMFFNYCLIFGNLNFPALGVAGAAIATLIARLVEIIIYIVMTFYLKTPIKLSIKKMFKFEGYIVKDYISKGYGLLSNELLWAVGIQTAAIIYTQRISENIAAYSIANVMINLLFIGMGGMSVAVSIIIGNKLGRGLFNEAQREAKKLMKLSSLVGITLGVLVVIMSYFITMLYNVSEETITMARYLVLITSFFSWLYYLNASIFFILRSGGDTKSVLIMDSGIMWFIVIPCALLVARLELYMPIHFLIIQTLDFIKLAVARYRYKKGRWLVNLTLHNNKMS